MAVSDAAARLPRSARAPLNGLITSFDGWHWVFDIKALPREKQTQTRPCKLAKRRTSAIAFQTPAFCASSILPASGRAGVGSFRFVLRARQDGLQGRVARDHSACLAEDSALVKCPVFDLSERETLRPLRLGGSARAASMACARSAEQKVTQDDLVCINARRKLGEPVKITLMCGQSFAISSSRTTRQEPSHRPVLSGHVTTIVRGHFTARRRGQRNGLPSV